MEAQKKPIKKTDEPVRTEEILEESVTFATDKDGNVNSVMDKAKEVTESVPEARKGRRRGEQQLLENKGGFDEEENASEDRAFNQGRGRKPSANAIFWWLLAAGCLALVIWYVFWEGPRDTSENQVIATSEVPVTNSNLVDNESEFNAPAEEIQMNSEAVAPPTTPAEENAPEAVAPETSSASTPAVTGNAEQAKIDELARKVIHGDFGDGQSRKAQLSGLYAQVQKRVNYLMSHS